MAEANGTRRARAVKDETGNVYGKLTVVGAASAPPGSPGRWWTCRCECGKEKRVNGAELRRKHVGSCGGPACNLKVKQETGNVYGKLTVTGFSRKNYWLCRCECGRQTEVHGRNLRNGSSTSCGARGCKACPHGLARHGMCADGYAIWSGMIQRCTNRNSRYYARYGGRGISVCERWAESPENFLADMGPRPSPRHSVDRIDNDGNYEPSNCRWATREEQARNRTSSVRVTLHGETHCVSEWSQILGIPAGRIYYRLKSGRAPEEALSRELL